MSGRSTIRSILLVALGAVLGATFVAPVAMGARNGSTPAATTYTRTWSCPGLGFQPVFSYQTYGANVAMRYGEGYFICPVTLPNGAVVKRVRFSLGDHGLDAAVRQCALVRSSFASAFDVDVMATVPATAGTPGWVRYADTTIVKATVKNADFGYYLQCEVTDDDTITGISGADIQYTVSAANG